MKIFHLVFLIFTTLAIITAAHADGMNHNSMKDMQMDNMKIETSKSQAHHANGIVKSIDMNKGTITIAHEPVASAHWPAMVMGFKATKDMMAAVKPEQPVEFEFTLSGMEAKLTKITAKN